MSYIRWKNKHAFIKKYKSSKGGVGRIYNIIKKRRGGQSAKPKL